MHGICFVVFEKTTVDSEIFVVVWYTVIALMQVTEKYVSSASSVGCKITLLNQECNVSMHVVFEKTFAIKIFVLLSVYDL